MKGGAHGPLKFEATHKHYTVYSDQLKCFHSVKAYSTKAGYNFMRNNMMQIAKKATPILESSELVYSDSCSQIIHKEQFICALFDFYQHKFLTKHFVDDDNASQQEFLGLVWNIFDLIEKLHG